MRSNSRVLRGWRDFGVKATAIILTMMCPLSIEYYALAVATVIAIFFGKRRADQQASERGYRHDGGRHRRGALRNGGDRHHRAR